MQDLCIYPIRLTALSPSFNLPQFSAQLRQNSSRAKSLDFKCLFGPDSRTPRTHLWGYRVSPYRSRSHFGHSTAHVLEFDPRMQSSSLLLTGYFNLYQTGTVRPQYFRDQRCNPMSWKMFFEKHHSKFPKDFLSMRWAAEVKSYHSEYLGKLVTLTFYRTFQTYCRYLEESFPRHFLSLRLKYNVYTR